MNRRAFLNTSVSASLLLAGSGILTAQTDSQSKSNSQLPRRQPNILMLLADDLGWGDLGCQGHPVLQTPAIDRLAAEGCRFTNFYVSMPICSPSRAACLTGRDPNRYGFKHVINSGMVNPNVPVPVVHHLPIDEPTLARQLRKAGYRTGTIGKWHLSLVGAHPTEPMPADYGFDESYITPGTGSLYHGPGRWYRNGRPEEIAADRWYPELYVDEAIGFMERHHETPFMLQLWSFSPHVREEASEPYRQRYAGHTAAEQTYYGCVTQMDEQYGRLLQYLDRSGLADNTIVVFFSDNGPEPPVLEANHPEARRGSTGGLRGGKHVLYEGGIRVPAIIRWPGETRPGMVCHEPVAAVDFLPSLCAAVGAPMPPTEVNLDGTDLRPAIRGESLKRPHPLYWECEYAQHTFVSSSFKSLPLALRDGPFKLMTDEAFEQTELYNLDWDPAEQWNLTAVYPEIKMRLREQIRSVHAAIHSGTANDSTRWLNPNLTGPQDIRNQKPMKAATHG